MSFARVYPMYVKKAESKGRTKAEVEEMKNVVSGGPTRALAFSQADAGLPDTISLN
jgi:hypothetical protein